MSNYKEKKQSHSNNYYITPSQYDFNIISIPMKTKYGIIRPIKVKEYPSLIVDLEILKMQDWEVKNWIKKTVKGDIIEDIVLSEIENKTMLSCIQSNILGNDKIGKEGLRDKYNNLFKKFVIDFDEKRFLFQFTSQKDFDEFRKQILDYNRINYIEWNPNPLLRKYQKMDIFAKKAINGSIDFDAIYTSLMCVGHSPHNINDYSLAQFYGAFTRLQLFKQYDTTTLYKTVDSSGKTEVVEWFKSALEKKVSVDKDWDEIQRENKNFTK